MPLIDTSTKLCAVIGNPVAHSLSPHMHNAAYRAANLNYVYLAFHVENVGDFLAGVRAMPSFCGVSVTIPHKRAVMPLLDEIDAMARHVGSVNTITHEDGRLIGSSTDGPGALRALTEAGVNFPQKRVLFLGAGGAVRAVAFAIAELTKAEHITILGRTPSHVNELVADLKAADLDHVSGGSIERDLRGAMASHDVIIQGTSVGMEPLIDESCIPAEFLRPDQIVFDMVYRPHETRLLREARDAGCQVVHGIEMLINQAALQFERWTGAACPIAAMRDAVLHHAHAYPNERAVNIVLIGARGSGKSAVAQALAELTGRTAISTDAELERTVGSSISDYVSVNGWDAFRDRESEIVAIVCAADNLIVDTGGGVVLRPANVDALRANGHVIWLRATVATMAARIGNATNRPSLTGAKSFVDEIAEVAAARAPLYGAAAHRVIDTDGRNPEHISAEIVNLTQA